VTLRYLKRRMQEYDEIREEIARLKEEVGKGKNSE
jgi:predicted translin family RNA/ssDNA-binding protein